MDDLKDVVLPPSSAPLDPVEDLKAQLRLREEKFAREKRELEAEHGRQLGLAKGFILSQENQLKKEQELRLKSDAEAKQWKEKLCALQLEAEGVRTAAALAQSHSQQEMVQLQQKYEEEIASLKHIMEVAASDSKDDVMIQLKAERDKWTNYRQQMELQVAQLKAQLEAVHRRQQQQQHPLQPSFPLHPYPLTGEGPSPPLADAERSQQRSIAQPQPPPLQQSQQGGEGATKGVPLKESFRWAQHNTEFMKSIVEPLEEEIAILKTRLRELQEKCDTYEGQLASLESSEKNTTIGQLAEGSTSSSLPLTATKKDTDTMIKELEHCLQLEKSSRMDLETFVAVLNEQKVVLQEEVENLKEDICRVCRRLEMEHSRHDELKRTWQMANDQFLETQRIHETHLIQISALLGPELLQKLSANLQQLIQNLSQDPNRRKSKQPKGKLKQELPPPQPSGVYPSSNNSAQRLATASPAIAGPPILHEKGDAAADADGNVEEEANKGAFSQNDVSGGGGSPNDRLNVKGEPLISLTKAFTPPPPPSSSVPISATAASAQTCLSMDALNIDFSRKLGTPLNQLKEGKGFKSKSVESLSLQAAHPSTSLLTVPASTATDSSKWEQMQIDTAIIEAELRECRKKLEQQRELISDYERRLQSLQRDHDVLAKASQIAAAKLHREANKAKIQLQRERQLRDQLEQSSASAAQELQMKVSLHKDENEALQILVADVQEGYKHLAKETEQQLALLGNAKAQLCSKVEDLNGINDSLQTKLDNVREEMGSRLATESEARVAAETQVSLLEEELTKERDQRKEIEEKLSNENMFLNDQVKSVQFSKEKLEEEMQSELDKVTEEMAGLYGVKAELEKVQAEREKDKVGREQAEQSAKTISLRSKQTILALQAQLEEEKITTFELKKRIQEQAAQIDNIKSQLETSESVQRDFVQLSQTLQVQSLSEK